MPKFKYDIKFLPAFDKRNPDPEINYGIGSVIISFAVIGPKGAVDWQMDSGWHLPNVHEELRENTKGMDYDFAKPKSRYLGYHSKVPQYKGQEKYKGKCDFLDACYPGGSYLNGDHLLPIFLEQGMDALWEELEELYKEIFSTPAK